MSFQKFKLAIAVILTFLFAACEQNSSEVHLPNELAGIRLVRFDRNQVAQENLSQMHHGVNFTEYQSVIGTYRDEATEFRVYVTFFNSEEKSFQMMSAMTENIKAGISPEFSYLKHIEKDGSAIHVAQSDSLLNYFFLHGKLNIWITAPAAKGEEVLNDFLEKFETSHLDM